MTALEKAARELAKLTDGLDCGDNSCRFARDKGGMRTNGGCRCWERLTDPEYSSKLRRIVSVLAALRAAIDAPPVAPDAPPIAPKPPIHPGCHVRYMSPSRDINGWYWVCGCGYQVKAGAPLAPAEKGGQR